MNKTVCVTGASGYLAKHIVYLLLQRGYKVHGTIRKAQHAYLNHLQGLFPNQLFLFQSDLMQPNSFDAALQGCDACLHTASPFFVHGAMTEQEADSQFIEPAVQGTLNVLQACVKQNVKRIVLTSSVAAVLDAAKPQQGKTYTEQDWNETSTKTEPMGAYRISKTRAEQTAWQFAKEKGLNLIVINPFLIAGTVNPEPTFLGADKDDVKASMGVLYNYLSGTASKASPATMGFVHVHDTALAHVNAMESDTAQGRYILSGPTRTYFDMAQVMKQMYPQYNIPTTCDQQAVPTKVYDIDNAKSIKDLGIQYASLEQIIKDTRDGMVAVGALQE